MASVTLNGVTFNSTSFPDYGYLSDTTGLFAMLTQLVNELAASTALQSISPGGSDRFIYAPTSTAWTSADVSSNSALVYGSQYYG
jgi:hypothetical protein